MKIKLGEISIVQTGFFAKSVSGGEVVYLQARHFDDQGSQVLDLRPDLYLSDIGEKHLLKKGDVLFAAKGFKNFAVCYNWDMPSVASTTFFVIRLQGNSVMPEYLVWYMNHPDIQAKLKGQAEYTSIASISKTALMELELLVPDIATQQSILRLAALREREKEISMRILQLKDKLIHQQIYNAINR